ncbi:MAG TPA: hypothetical protein PK613_19175 [Anaerolineaceae bacterium]|nr:hypothetical protein [Anaerolineaceae bacterium]
MIDHSKDLKEFYEAVEQEKSSKQKLLLDNPEKEQNRLRWLEFRHNIESVWLPVLEEYLNVIGKLWFGFEMRLKGSEFRKELVSSPAYYATHEVFGPMAIFWVTENDWEEREALYSETEMRLELFKRGYRCRIVIQDDGRYDFQDDASNTLVKFDTGHKIDREELLQIFADAFLDGPQEIYKRWKDFDIGRNQEQTTGVLPE